MDGRFIFDENYHTTMLNVRLDLELKQGIYFIVLSNEETSSVAKVIIN
jgi:hypothetical protein